MKRNPARSSTEKPSLFTEDHDVEFQVALQKELVAAERRVDELREALREYADHSSWRCAYRSRYKTCRCGLDETMTRLGLEPVEVIDPEAECDSTEGL